MVCPAAKRRLLQLCTASMDIEQKSIQGLCSTEKQLTLSAAVSMRPCTLLARVGSVSAMIDTPVFVLGLGDMQYGAQILAIPIAPVSPG